MWNFRTKPCISGLVKYEMMMILIFYSMYALEIRQIELGRPTKNSRFSCRSFSYALLSVRAIHESYYNQTLKSTNINIWFVFLLVYNDFSVNHISVKHILGTLWV